MSLIEAQLFLCTLKIRWHFAGIKFLVNSLIFYLRERHANSTARNIYLIMNWVKFFASFASNFSVKKCITNYN